MTWAVWAARGVAGLVFVVFGLNGFFQLIALPPLPEPAGPWIGTLVRTRYLHVVKGLEIAGGLMLLTGRFVPLGLTLLTPIAVNILLFEVFLVGGPGPGVLWLGLLVFLIWAYRAYFAPVFTPRAVPGTRAVADAPAAAAPAAVAH